MIVFILALAYIINHLEEGEEIKQESDLLNTIEIEETQVTPQKTERMLQIEKLQEQNSDIVGWIEVEGTNIN